MTDKSYPPPCRNYLQTLYLSVTLYACAQREFCNNTKLIQIKLFTAKKIYRNCIKIHQND